MAQPPPDLRFPFIMLPPGMTAQMFPGGIETEEEIRKRSTMQNLFQVGVIFKHKRSKVLWEVIEVKKTEDGDMMWAVMKSQSSGYKKWFKPSKATYDSLNIHQAPEALKVLFGDQKHQVEAPQEAEQAFEITEINEEDISE